MHPLRKSPVIMITLAAASLAFAQTRTWEESKAAATADAGAAESALEMSPGAGSAAASQVLGKRKRDDTEDGRPAKVRRLDAAGARSRNQAEAPARVTPLAFTNDSDWTWKITIPELTQPFVLERSPTWGGPVEHTERLDPAKDLNLYIHPGLVTLTPVDPSDRLALEFKLYLPADEGIVQPTCRLTWSLEGGKGTITRGWQDGKGSADPWYDTVVLRKAEGIEFHTWETVLRSWMTRQSLDRIRHHGR